ncbi:carcinoembryonic antigen-related cell adhesion molecule 1-like protein [Labeo rohita]|uniref:Carcinoembryonic antigen-related cell adhesion molecule 1-like protein n=1 Tax=Labeo rohita TaxID=84645 RepID=A0A498NZW8_LABRO|nr:carcinoembryonic antigen-related cell adhesion molecule 1-like protein [Labeo rohita]
MLHHQFLPAASITPPSGGKPVTQVQYILPTLPATANPNSPSSQQTSSVLTLPSAAPTHVTLANGVHSGAGQGIRYASVPAVGGVSPGGGGQHCEGKEDGKKGSKMERESERDVGGGPSQTERARAMEGETETQAETNSKDESREAGRREASVLDPPPPPLQTDPPSAKKIKFRPPPLKNTTDAGCYSEGSLLLNNKINGVIGKYVTFKTTITLTPNFVIVTWNFNKGSEIAPILTSIVPSNTDNVDEKYASRISYNKTTFELQLGPLVKEDGGEYTLTIVTDKGQQLTGQVDLEVLGEY